MGAIKDALKWLVRRVHRSVAGVVDDPYRQLRGRIGQGVMIHRGCVFVAVEGIRLGDWVYIGPNARMSGSGGLEVGSNVAIGPHVTINTSNHRLEGADWVPFGADLDKRPVRIEDHAWIGSNVVILPGVTIGRGAVVGAGSVVTRDVPPCAVVGGNPADVIKYRDREAFERLVSQGRFWMKELAQGRCGPST